MLPTWEIIFVAEANNPMLDTGRTYSALRIKASRVHKVLAQDVNAVIADGMVIEFDNNVVIRSIEEK